MLLREKVRNDFACVFSRYAPALFETNFHLVPPADNSRCNLAYVSKSNFSVSMVFEFHEELDFRACRQRMVQANLRSSRLNCFQPPLKYVHALCGPIRSSQRNGNSQRERRRSQLFVLLSQSECSHSPHPKCPYVGGLDRLAQSDEGVEIGYDICR